MDTRMTTAINSEANKLSSLICKEQFDLTKDITKLVEDEYKTRKDKNQ